MARLSESFVQPRKYMYAYGICECLNIYCFFFNLQKIEKPFLEAVKTTLDERYTENIETIYKIAIRLIIETLIQGYEKGPSSGQ